MQVRSAMSAALLATAVVIGGHLAANASGSGAAKAGAAAPAGAEASFVPITPCRIVDTRRAGGMVLAGHPRQFVAASDTGLAGQGGSAAGCGVPKDARSVQANVVSVGAAGSGYLTVYPGGATAPLASWLNFRDGKAIANGGTITLSDDGSSAFGVKVSRSTHVVVDVTGYYAPRLWAGVSSAGTISGGSRVVSVANPATGSFVVTFDGDVSGCAYSATVWDTPGYSASAKSSGFSDASSVEVHTSSNSGTATNVGFWLVLTC